MSIHPANSRLMPATLYVGAAISIVACGSATAPDATSVGDALAPSRSFPARVTASDATGGDPCDYSFGPQTPASATGGTMSVDLTAFCVWTASSDQTWLRTTARATGWSAKQRLSYTVDPNPFSPTRTGRIVVTGSGRTTQLLVTQPGAAPCDISVTPTGATLPATGGNGESIVVSDNCGWIATSNQGWLTVTSAASGTTTGRITYSVAPNTGSIRYGRIIVNHPGGSTDIGITQAAPCTLSVAPSEVTIAAAGGSRQSSISASGGDCAWSAESDQSWITIGGGSGRGSGTISYEVAPNGSGDRTGRIVVTYNGGRAEITVRQVRLACTLDVSPNAVRFGPAGGSGQSTVTVGTVGSCSWTARANDSWITITSGGAGSTSGVVSYSVPYNSLVARVGSITVSNGDTSADITITQTSY